MENKDYEELAKTLKFTQLCCGISSLLTGALIVTLVVIFMQFKPVLEFVNTLGPAVENVSQGIPDVTKSTPSVGIKGNICSGVT